MASTKCGKNRSRLGLGVRSHALRGIVLAKRDPDPVQPRIGTEDPGDLGEDRRRRLPGRHGPAFYLNRASFCCHALERLVERSQVALNLPLLETVDAEAVRLLRNQALGRMINDAEDSLIRAVAKGVWAGGVDQMSPEVDWGLTLCDGAARLPGFSVRTFLGPAQMRPTVWLKWNDDQTMQMAA